VPRWLLWTVAILSGAVVATTGDHLHVVYGVLFYPHPVLFQQPIWVFPLFMGASWAMVLGSPKIGRAPTGTPVRANLADAALATGAFFIAYAFTAVAAELPNFVLVVLVLTWLMRVRSLPRAVLLYGLVAAAGGVAFESTLSAFGGFYYLNPDFLGVPRWLPGIYLHAAVAGIRIRQLL
jgi:hypothetical protein